MIGMPMRGDVVEQFIKSRRDEYRIGDSEWYALDDLLDDYRLYADTGTKLTELVPDPTEPRFG